MKNKKKRSWQKLLVGIMLFILLFLSIGLLSAVIILALAGFAILYESIDVTIISIVVSAILAITTFIFTKRHENKLFNQRDLRDNNRKEYQEYIEFLLEYSIKQEWNLEELMRNNAKIILKVSDDVIERINWLIDAIKNQKDVPKHIIYIINQLRLDLGIRHDSFFKDADDFFSDINRTELLRNATLAHVEKNEDDESDKKQMAVK